MKDDTPAFSSKRKVQLSGYASRDIDVNGMTLRDYFAAKAMQALANHGTPYSKIAREAYALADEMMEARK